ncbi:glycosyltransferase family 2 protein [Chryseobacterium sp. POL2]|uniref:glycosyltransferase family 2 protein n=1 Tax=Chryseobacterium sp. POL2 TaxID=2713414 RepID=UPI0013E11136|nr:glycosyltransferase family 2 protein [Chryseobacterium sp. POL2]QIG90344.1 glycosyltransferase family 2 protein [Chryseobacterium sp. POL2]
MKSITVFTPTFNRAHLLPRLYESLKNQTSKDFVWMIIDDGSVDDTKSLIAQWREEADFEIQYHYKENGGMHTAHNLAYSLTETELNVCIDSDDAMTKDAIELIVKLWESIDNKSNVAGIIGLDVDREGKIIGTKIPEHLEKGSLHDLYHLHNVKGDKKLVLRTDVVRSYPPYPEYEGEKLVPLGILYLMIGKDYNLLYANDVYCIVEYQDGGSTNSILKQYKQSPRGFAYSRKLQIKHGDGISNEIKNYVHLISSSIFAKDIPLAFKGVNPLKSLFIYPFGILLHIYILLKIKSS